MKTDLRAEAIRTLYSQMQNTAGAGLVITVYMVATAWPFTPATTVLTWAAVALSTQVLRQILIRRFNTRESGDLHLELWAKAFVAHQALIGLVWGSTVFLFIHLDQPITVALVLCCLYSIAAGGVPAQAYTPISFYVLVFCLFSQVLIRLLSTGQFAYILVGIASALFGLTMVGYCRVQSRAVYDGFRIRFENLALVEALTVQKAEAEAARRKAELASLAKSQFLAAASHDLRQPLYALSLFSASLNELKLDVEGKAVVSNIQVSIGAMESLFNGLLDLSKLQAGVVEARFEAVRVDSLFDQLGQYFHPIASERGLTLRFCSNVERVTSDATLLEQVLGNLISNALNNTVKGGVLVTARVTGRVARFQVWDTGTGIGESNRQKIFEEFVQLGNPERDRSKGLGLGLAIAQRAAALIGGSIGLSSRLGRGSTFSLLQPVAAPTAQSQLSRPPGLDTVPLVGWSQDLPLLIVDDDRDVRAALSDLLRRWNVSFEAMADAAQALASIAAGKRFGLVIVDYRLVGPVNGLELIAMIRQQHPPPLPPAVVITGDFDPGLLTAARARGVPLVHKPLKISQLRALLGLEADVVTDITGGLGRPPVLTRVSTD